MGRFFTLFVIVGYLSVAYLADAQCFTSSSGATCCPQSFPCSSTRCIIDRECFRGASTCTANVCLRPGETPPPTPPPPPSASPSPQPPAPPPSTNDGPGGTAYDQLLQCNGRRTRKEVRDMTDNEWNDFVNAFNAMRNRASLRNPSVNQFEDLAHIHREFVIEAHGGSYFLPWHRFFVLLYENLIRRENPNVAIPYWNWAYDASDPALSTVWNRVGGGFRDGAGNPTCIPNGPFFGLQTTNTAPHCVRRGFTNGQSGSMIPFDNWLTIQALMQRNMPYEEFTVALESTHGSPHVGIGGDMAVLGTAPNDPLFFMHHTFVDYIYRRWQDNGSGSPDRFGGSNPGVVGETNQDSVMQAFQRNIRSAQGLDCVQYEDYSGSFGINSGGKLDLTVQSLPEDFMETNNINKDRAAHGHKVLQETLDGALGVSN